MRTGARPDGRAPVRLKALYSVASSVPGVRIEQQPPRSPCGVAELEHVRELSRQRVERAAADLTGTPVVLDETEDRAEVSGVVIDEVLLRKRRDHDQRLTGAVPA